MNPTKIKEAAEAVINRWDSPQWEWDKHGHTASLIAHLRTAIAELDQPLRVYADGQSIDLNKGDSVNLEGGKPPVVHRSGQHEGEVAVDSTQLIGDVKERWRQLRERGEDGPHALTEDPWRSFYNGWIEGRADLLSLLRRHPPARVEDPTELQEIITLLRRAKVGTKWARDYEEQSNAGVKSVIGIEFDKDADNMARKLRSRLSELLEGQPAKITGSTT